MGLLIGKQAIEALRDLPDDARRNAEAFVRFLDSLDLSTWSEEIGVGLVRGIRRGLTEGPSEKNKPEHE